MDRRSIPDLAAFALLAELRSFRRAGEVMGVSASALSHRLRRMETALGVRLLNRSTRAVAPTEAGERLLARLSPALADIEAGLMEVAAFRERPAGRLRLSVPRSAARLAIAPRLGGFLKAYPDIRVEVVSDNALIDIVAGGFDAGIRFDENLPAEMVAVRIGKPLRMAAVASPEYLARRGVPKTPEDLAGHACFRLRWPSGAFYEWELEKGDDVRRVAVDGPLIVDDAQLLKDAAVDGAGIAFVAEPSVRAELESGALVRLLEDWCPPFPGYSIYYPSRRQVSPALRAFIDWMRGAPPERITKV
ncbi:MAG: LysR family transcriptional regulator [Phenylobacterium sp.]|uniref:LysR family transcriptional regulator n=1 Tax=Phenylobacterium sp. TaxID=1871053 RepID=UPI001A1FB9DE|nr:LysR family transcriptional regulator [Phenylobacterium sp.]MBJ7408982.1 LysR family transcriptional regulator [Phenylobacterium sp.]